MNTTPQNNSLASQIVGAPMGLQFGKIVAGQLGIGQHLAALTGISQVNFTASLGALPTGFGKAFAAYVNPVGMANLSGLALSGIDLNRLARSTQYKINPNLSAMFRRSVEEGLK